ncbi:MAG: ATP synthase F1 subunit epsilon [Myxococcota bacterium]|nr:ATP synthase F1 subunit epsilon [Myxococcota bacterium]
MAKMNLSIVTPTGSVVDAVVVEVTVPGAAGMFTVYAEHQPALIMLGGGVLSYQGLDGDGEIFIRGGVAEISSDSILIMTDYALTRDEIDRDKAADVLQQANRRLEESEYLGDDQLLRINIDQRYAESVLDQTAH